MNMVLSKLSSSGNEIFDIFNENTVCLSTVDAAKFLGISQNALRILVCRGKVKFYKLGNRLKFSRSDLMAVLKKGN